MRPPAASGTSRAAPSQGKPKAYAWSVSPCSKTIGSTGGTTTPRRRSGARAKPVSSRRLNIRRDTEVTVPGHFGGAFAVGRRVGRRPGGEAVHVAVVHAEGRGN